MTYEVVMPYHLHMPSYFLGTFTEYPFLFLNSQFSNNILRTDRFVAYDSSDSFGKHIGNA